MPINYKDISELTEETNIAGTEKVPVSSTKYVLFNKIKDWIINSLKTTGLDLGGNKLKNAGFEVVTTLPTTNNFVGRRVTYEGRSYIWDGSSWKCDADTLGGSNKSTFFQNGAVVMNTNPFGGRPLYINSLDNAMYAANKRFSVVVTRHLVTYNGETYPKLNPDYVSSYSVTGSGTSYSVSDSPSDIIVYNNNTLCSEVSIPTTQNQYSYSGGILTFGSSVTGTIYVYPKSNVTQYIDSPVVSTQLDSSFIFDGNYESGLAVSSGYYMKIRIMMDVYENPFLNAVDYPYGSLFLSYYYNQTPAHAQLRIYNKTYRPHGVGWKKYDFIDFVGNNSGSGYIQSYYSGGDYGRSIMEFIIIAHNTHSTQLTEIDWRLDRPSLSRTGATVTKYTPQTLYYPLTVLDRVISNESINFDTNNIEPTQTGTVTKTSTWLWQYLVQSVNWLKAKAGKLTDAVTITDFTTFNPTTLGLEIGESCNFTSTSATGSPIFETSTICTGEIQHVYSGHYIYIAYSGANTGLYPLQWAIGGYNNGFKGWQLRNAQGLLNLIKTVDGTDSGLDADLLDGKHATDFATAAQGAKADTALQSITKAMVEAVLTDVISSHDHNYTTYKIFDDSSGVFDANNILENVSYYVLNSTNSLNSASLPDELYGDGSVDNSILSPFWFDSSIIKDNNNINQIKQRILTSGSSVIDSVDNRQNVISKCYIRVTSGIGAWTPWQRVLTSYDEYNGQADWNQTDPSQRNYIQNKPDIITINNGVNNNESLDGITTTGVYPLIYGRLYGNTPNPACGTLSERNDLQGFLFVYKKDDIVSQQLSQQLHDTINNIFYIRSFDSYNNNWNYWEKIITCKASYGEQGNSPEVESWGFNLDEQGSPVNTFYNIDTYNPGHTKELTINIPLDNVDNYLRNNGPDIGEFKITLMFNSSIDSPTLNFSVPSPSFYSTAYITNGTDPSGYSGISGLEIIIKWYFNEIIGGFLFSIFKVNIL